MLLNNIYIKGLEIGLFMLFLIDLLVNLYWKCFLLELYLFLVMYVFFMVVSLFGNGFVVFVYVLNKWF